MAPICSSQLLALDLGRRHVIAGADFTANTTRHAAARVQNKETTAKM